MKAFVLLLLPILMVSTKICAQPGSLTVVAVGANWKFYDQNGDLGTAWRAEAYNDATWASGPSPLGYSPNNEDMASTTVCNGCTNCDPNCTDKRITTYFRHHVSLTDLSQPFSITYQRDDGIVIYVNGTEVHRENLPAAPATIVHSTTATILPTSDEALWIQVPSIPNGLFHTGDNVIAVEIHQPGPTSSDMRFNMVVATATPLVRGPYLQMGTPNEMTVRWRTTAASIGQVRYWTSQPGSQTLNANESSALTEHEKRLTDLSANTQYFYSIGATDGSVLQSTANNYFYTPPTAVAGASKTTKIWAIGDFGDGGQRQLAVKEGFKTFAGTNYVDMWLWLGDNAYNKSGTFDGRDSVYQSYVFDIYGPDRFMRQTPFYATPGNHDYYSTEARRIDHDIDYYDIVTNFRGGPSANKEEYYSFNHNNIHIVSLDSYGYEGEAVSPIFDPNGVQMTWLKADLAAAQSDPAIAWIIVFMHHPPYTKGTHDSDTESDLTSIRQRLVPILDNYRVDLVLSGHSHVYERTKLMKGHTGVSSTFSPPTHNAPPANNEPTPNFYYKSRTATANEGIMYIVCGSSGGRPPKGSIPNHLAMDESLDEGGSLYLEVLGNQLVGKFIGTDATTKDQFTIIKTGPSSTNTLLGDGAGGSVTSTNQQNTLIGYQAGFSNTSGLGNTFLGAQTGYSNTTGFSNVAVGRQAGYKSITGHNIVAVGDSAGYNNTASDNLFVGSKAGLANTTGGSNTFIGYRAGGTNATGEGNTLLGSYAGLHNTTGIGNTFLGDGAGYGNRSGHHNVYLGQYAGISTHESSSQNVFIGHNTGVFSAAAPITNAVALGANTHVSVSNAIVLGHDANVGIGTSSPLAKLEVVSNASGTSGLRLTNLKAGSPVTAPDQTRFLTVNETGDVVLGSIRESSSLVTLSPWLSENNLIHTTNPSGISIGPERSSMPVGYNLYVSGGIVADRISVSVNHPNKWSDHVFMPGYSLRSLAVVEQYIKTNKRLPGMPSSVEMVQTGNDLHQTDAKLLEKIEELTLYVLALKRDLKRQQQQINQLQKSHR